MNTSILIGVGQRLIPRVHNRPIVLHPFEEIVHDVVGPLGNLERHDRPVLGIPQPRPMQNEPADLHPLIGITGATDSPGAGENLPGD